MRMSRKDMEISHARIVEGAKRLIRERGFDNTSVSDVMNSASLTQGGFYRHFETKDDLLLAALEDIFREHTDDLARDIEVLGPQKGVQKYRERYLSKGHKDHPHLGCPIPAVGADVGRASENFNSVFSSGVARMVDLIARNADNKAPDMRAQVMRELALMAGTIMIARACEPDLAEEFIAAAKGYFKVENQGEQA